MGLWAVLLHSSVHRMHLPLHIEAAHLAYCSRCHEDGSLAEVSPNIFAWTVCPWTMCPDPGLHPANGPHQFCAAFDFFSPKLTYPNLTSAPCPSKEWIVQTGTHRPRDTSKGGTHPRDASSNEKRSGTHRSGTDNIAHFMLQQGYRVCGLWHCPTAFDILTNIGIPNVPDKASVSIPARNHLRYDIFSSKKANESGDVHISAFQKVFCS